MKYLEIHLTKYLCTENYKISLRDIKEDLKKWKDIPSDG